ncbi:MAG: hypothetical protein BGP13_17570 [Sphingobacteriales bacterium 40-81]|nr:MAG: hypothetical protein BGP13_17570 [Sphingobacteriales bacterium 40-81]
MQFSFLAIGFYYKCNVYNYVRIGCTSSMLKIWKHLVMYAIFIEQTLSKVRQRKDDNNEKQSAVKRRKFLTKASG